MEKLGPNNRSIASVYLVLAIFGTGLLALPTNILSVAYWTGRLSTSPAHEEIWILIFRF